MEEQQLCHLHLTINAKVDMEGKPLSKERCENFVKKLLKEAEMLPLGGLCYADAVDQGNPGQSFVQMITTSHCSLHYFSKSGEIYFDLYSCKKFDPGKIVALVHREFKTRESTSSITERVPCLGGTSATFRSL
ncbi:MAG: S-adenosylmethionine decarboxylase [Candidatus Micrarchaeia archaeon]